MLLATSEAFDDRARAAETWIYPGLILILILATDYYPTHPALVTTFGSLNLVLSLVRFLLIRYDRQLAQGWPALRRPARR